MSGHSKWSTIRRKKGVADAKRGQQFTKIAKIITVAAKQGGGDSETNFKLRLAIDKAKSVNMPQENIERAIKRGTGELAGAKIENLTYEAYGPGGIALMIEVVTDNKNRTLGELKQILSKFDGRLGGEGSVRWMFARIGAVRISLSKKKEKEIVELTAIDAGASDIKEENGSLVVYTEPEKISAVKKSIEPLKPKIESIEIELVTKNPVKIEDKFLLRKIDQLMEELDSQDDVNEIYSNVEN
jgi:YebC/PmpR family DNA-binding regulatory protein